MEQTIYTVWLSDENGREKQFDVVGTFADDKKEYMALEATDGEDKGLIFFVRIFPGKDDELLISQIETDEEYVAVSELFESLFNENNIEEEYFLDDNFDFNKQDMAYSDHEYCYMDEEGRMFIFDDLGNPVFLDENGDIVD